MKRSATNKAAFQSRTLWLTVLLGAAVVGYAFGVFLPGQRATAELRSQLRARRLAIMQADRLLYPIFHAQEEVEQTEAFLAKAREAAPSDFGISSVMADIHQQALEAEVEIVLFEPRLPTALETIQQHPLAITVEGTFSALWSFVERVESLAAPTWMCDLHLQPKSEGSDILQMRVVLTVFSNCSENSR